MEIELRRNQIESIHGLKRSLSQKNRVVMVQAPTGFGKTVLACAIVEGARAKGNRVIFVVPSISLVDQTVASFRAQGISGIGVIQAAHELTDPDQPVQIATVQSLKNRRIPHADIVIIDEAHIWYKFYETWMESWNKTPFVGLSATPWTKGLGKHYEDLIIVTSTQELINDGYLSDFVVFAPTSPDLSKVRTKAGDYHEGDLSTAMNKKEITADIVNTWKEKGKGRPTLCYGVDRAHAKHMQNEFILGGVKCGYIDAFTDREEREDISEQLHRGELEVVCNVGCLTTGIDWDIRCIILARPTKSEILFTQIVGRGLRTAPGKDHCLILDHSDTHNRLGFVTDIAHKDLCDGKPNKAGERKERDEPLPKKCSACDFMKPAKVHICPNCGFAPQKQSTVKVKDGVLEELIRGKKKKPKKYTKEQKQEWYSMIKYIAQSRGYKSGWIAHTYKSKFDVWPKGLSDISLEPSDEVASYVTSCLIRNSKRKRA